MQCNKYANNLNSRYANHCRPDSLARPDIHPDGAADQDRPDRGRGSAALSVAGFGFWPHELYGTYANSHAGNVSTWQVPDHRDRLPRSFRWRNAQFGHAV